MPTILHVHGGFYARSRAKRLLYSLYDSPARRHNANVFDHLITRSEGDRESLLKLNVPHSSISIIRNAAETKAFEAVGATQFRERHGLVGRRVILYLSILHHFKRPEKLVRVLPRLIEKDPDVFLLLVRARCRGNPENCLRQPIRRRGVACARCPPRNAASDQPCVQRPSGPSSAHRTPKPAGLIHRETTRTFVLGERRRAAVHSPGDKERADTIVGTT